MWRFIFILIYSIFLYQLWILSHVVYWNVYNPTTSAFMQNRLNVMREKDAAATLFQTWIPYELISVQMKRAIIVAEDAKFKNHKGFDFDAIQNAFEKNLEAGRMVAGGSTISQQLAKNLFLSDKKSLLRKIQEAIITLMLENIMSKRRILEIYLNIIEWGNGIFGVEAAAHHYYATPALSLTAEQATYLAAMVTNPRYYDKNRQSQRLLKKGKIFLKRLHSAEIP
nr:monofunctional biosynthetic peptidoglycan transglycosylase [Nitrosomonas cryotolerans]